MFTLQCLSLLVLLSLIVSVSLSRTDEPGLENDIVIFKHPKKGLKNALSMMEASHYWLDHIINANKSDNSRIIHRYCFGNHLEGIAGNLSSWVLQQIENNTEVLVVEKDAYISIRSLKINDTCKYQSNATWNLARVSSMTLNKENDHRYRFPNQGKDAIAYVLDTGINIHHIEFSGRASWGKTVIPGFGNVDGNGHGTHVAGIIGGSSFGIAKKIHLIAVKVLDDDGSGSISNVLAGLNWVYNDYEIRTSSSNSIKNLIINLSVGVPVSNAWNKILDLLVQSGIHITAAAGNDNIDACTTSPSSNMNIYSIGASNAQDEKTFFSNQGPCITLFAPGYNIQSSWIGPENNETRILSGTSMASPHVAGVISLYLSSGKYNTYSPEELKKAILKDSLSNIMSNVPSNTSNKLISTVALLKSMHCNYSLSSWQ